YKRGTIMRFVMECDDPQVEEKPKYGIILNLDSKDEEALLAITTSQIDFYDNRRFEDEILRVSPGSYSCFTEETVISLRVIRPEPVARLKTLAASGTLTFHGQLSDDDMAIIEQKIIRSRVIERGYKKKIIPNYRPT